MLTKIADTSTKATPLTSDASSTTNDVTSGFCSQIARELRYTVKKTSDMLRLKQRRDPAIPPLDSVRGQIEKGLRESKAYELALQKGNSLLEQLKKENDIAKVAQANSLKVEETGLFQRAAAQLPKIGDLAELKAGSIALSAQKPVPEKLYTQKDAVYVLAFKDSQGADMSVERTSGALVFKIGSVRTAEEPNLKLTSY